MSRRTRLSAAERRRHDRAALLQWVGLVLVAVLGLLAAFFLFGGDDGTQLNAPPAARAGTTS